LLSVYPNDDDVDVRIMGGANAAAQILGRTGPPSSWLVYDSRDLSLRAFLFQIDFFVYFPSERVEYPPLEVLALAMASGAIVVVPQRFLPYLGGAAVYCSPEDVTATIHRYHKDPEVIRDQITRGLAFVAKYHSPDRYAAAVSLLMGSGSPADRGAPGVDR
jgi:hypothetical protein